MMAATMMKANDGSDDSNDGDNNGSNSDDGK